MASKFSVHVDKENATPAAIFNKKPVGSSARAFGPQKHNKLAQPTPRKALCDVNRDPQLSGPAPKLGGLSLKDNVNHPVKPSKPTASHGENKAASFSIKKDNITKPKESIGEKKATKHSHHKPGKKTIPEQEDDEDGYNSDSIFPRTERLSTYVDKLFSWRPPCLFGTIPDSESDTSMSSDHEDPLNTELLVEEPPFYLPEVSELSGFDLDSLLVGFPLEEPVASNFSQQSPDSPDDLSLIPTPDTSMSFGNLKVMNNSLQMSDPEQREDDIHL